ncbi:hypothetical protein F5879DRAFT_932478 [Lentinula edodes]|nr:hypothetical protein F5879DRAFT_932478 [Lentinula edodes]
MPIQQVGSLNFLSLGQVLGLQVLRKINICVNAASNGSRGLHDGRQLSHIERSDFLSVCFSSISLQSFAGIV